MVPLILLMGFRTAAFPLRFRKDLPKSRSASIPDDEYMTLAGLVYDPFTNELWTAIRGGPARLNGQIVHVSQRRRLDEAIVSVGFAKNADSLSFMLPVFNNLISKVRKIRIMGAAALGIVYVGTGRFDAYWESGLRLWDIAAGGLIVECAGGEFWRQPLASPHAYHLLASNGLLRKKLLNKANISAGAR